MSICLLIFLLLSYKLILADIEGYELPLLPINPPLKPFYENITIATDKYIPRNAWIAVRDTKSIPKNLIEMKEKNSNWSFHLCDNNCKDSFMEYYYYNTSTLWAYNILNPIIGTSKVELWRLGVLYAYGGMYMDDDAIISQPIDNIISINDTFIIGKENYNWTDNCYKDYFPISNHSLYQKYGSLNEQIFFDNKYFLNWLFFSCPSNYILARSLYHAVELIKGEYVESFHIKFDSSKEQSGKILMCATTYQITLSIREIILEFIYINVYNYLYDLLVHESWTDYLPNDLSTILSKYVTNNNTIYAINYLPIKLSDYLNINISNYLPTNISNYQPNYEIKNLSTYLRTNLPDYLHSHLPNYVPVNPSNYLSYLGIHICTHNFEEYGGNMKAWYSDWKPDHWVRLINHHHYPYLRRHQSSVYSKILHGEYDNELLQSPMKKSVFLIRNKTRHNFPNLDTFVAMGFDFDNVTLISYEELENIPLGDTLPNLSYR